MSILQIAHYKSGLNMHNGLSEFVSFIIDQSLSLLGS